MTSLITQRIIRNGIRFEITDAYLQGAWDRQRNTCQNPYKNGPLHAQYKYGHTNEGLGLHDPIDLPFERIGK